MSKAFKNRGDAHARKGALEAAAAVDPAPPPPPPVPSGPSMLERFLALEKTLRIADPATILRYQVRLREAGHYAGAADGRLNRALLQGLADCMQAGCTLP